MKSLLSTTVLVLIYVCCLQAQPQAHYDLTEGNGTATALKKGTQVLASWSYDDFWYPGTIEATDGDKVFVRFTDNEKEWIVREKMIPLKLSKGDQVFCKKLDGLVYRLAEIGLVEGDKIFVQYTEDGTTEWNEVKNIRIKQ